MKACSICLNEIHTRDGVNTCAKCENRSEKNKKARQNRKRMDDAMASIGLVRVRGSMGGTYYE